jgi:hypothetical protein
VSVNLAEDLPRPPVAGIRGFYSGAVRGTAVLPVHFSSVIGLYLGYRVCMDELEEACLREATMSHREILLRFKRLFGREMTPKERQNFFLPHDSSAATEENR